MAHQHWAWLIDRATGERRRVPLVDAQGADPALYTVEEHEEDGVAPHYPAAPEIAPVAPAAESAALATEEPAAEQPQAFTGGAWPADLSSTESEE